MRCSGVVLGIWACVPVLLGTGCGADPLGRQPIRGTVSFNGTPLASGTINFSPVDSAKTATGGQIEAGRFAFDREQGLAAGMYRVTINAPKPGTVQMADDNTLPGDPLPVPEELIPPEWNTGSKEVIEVEDTGPQEFNFEVQSQRN
jgi:hypothetical protein